MTKKIEEDRREFQKIIEGKIRKELKEGFSTGKILKRPKNGKGVISMPIPIIHLPEFRYGKANNGYGAGKGKPGDVLKDPDKKGKDGKPSQEAGEGMLVDIDLETVVRFLKDELKLPNLKPKDSKVLEEVKIKYKDISLVGVNSLLHKKKTFLQAMKRSSAMGTLDQKFQVPGIREPVPVVQIINDDRRFRQYCEIKSPSHKAVIFFARDGSGSMDDTKIEIVNDMAWWIDIWIRFAYGENRTERSYIWHDTEAKQVSERQFYRQRYGGGTTCSSSLKLINKLIKHRYPADRYNIYVFYFGDGDNWQSDNDVFVNCIKELEPNNRINYFGMTQILSYHQQGLKEFVDSKIESKDLDGRYVKTTSIARSGDNDGMWYTPGLNEDERASAIKKAIIDLLGNSNLAQASQGN